jgi:hypothetical protein
MLIPLGILGASAFSSSYELIATTVLSSNGTPVFTNIPQTYQHLQVRAATLVAGSTNGATYEDSWAINSDYNGSNYNTHQLRGNGSSTSSIYRSSGMFLQHASFTSGQLITNAAVVDFLDYRNTSKFKTVRLFGGVSGPSGSWVTLSSGLWRSTAAITSLEYNYGGTAFAAGSRVSLYGIRG